MQNHRTSGITAKQVRDMFSYDRVTGVFTSRGGGQGRRPVGKRLGYLTELGYGMLNIGNKAYPAHRVAWLYVYGEWPAGEVDHIDMDRANNRIANLRLVDRAQNVRNRAGANRNNKLGVRGVKRLPSGRFQARVTKNREAMYLGVFDTVKDARDAVTEARAKLFGEYAGRG